MAERVQQKSPKFMEQICMKTLGIRLFDYDYGFVQADKAGNGFDMRFGVLEKLKLKTEEKGIKVRVPDLLRDFQSTLVELTGEKPFKAPSASIFSSL